MKTLLLVTALLLSFFQGFAQEFPQPMPNRMVSDFARLFSPQENAALEQKLRNFNDTSSTQIAIATVPSLYGYDPNDYAQRLAEKWGVGQKGKDNGVLLLVKPKTNNERGEVAIAVGYGLEGAIPDAIASQIIRNEMIPAFQQGNYYAGVNKAANVLMDLSGGEYTADEYARKHGDGVLWPFLIPFGIIFLLPLFVRRRRGYTTGSHHGGVPPFFIGGWGGGGFGSFSGGGGSFGGFGGGGFGGGGASGSW